MWVASRPASKGCPISTLKDIEVFTAVVDAGSFSGAARTLGISKSYTSKQVQRLEERLGVSLLQRTTRRLSLTPAGAKLHGRAAAAMQAIAEAERLAMLEQTEPTGVLRVGAPMSFGQKYIVPAIADFLTLHPALQVEADLNDARVDILESGLDLLVRVGILQDSSHLARKLAPVQGVLSASPAYLAKFGTPVHPRELTRHQCLRYSLQQKPDTWHLVSESGEVVSVPVQGPFTCNNGDALLKAATAGHGIFSHPDFLGGEALRQGELVPVLPEWHSVEGALWVIYPQHRHQNTKTSIFVAFLVDRFRDPPWRHEA